MGHLPTPALTATHRLEAAVWRVLAGEPPNLVAARLNLPPSQLAAAAKRYRVAGHAALLQEADNNNWQQTSVKFADPRTGEHAMADGVGMVLDDAELDQLVDGWWFVRKTPWWRLRWMASRQTPPDAVGKRLTVVLDRLQAKGHVVAYQAGIYEPETFAFGGPAGMAIAHDLFHADSRNILTHLRDRDADTPRTTVGAVGFSILLCSVLFRAAGQDWYEQGDIWARVSACRPASGGGAAQHRNSAALRRLLITDASPHSQLLASGPLTEYKRWITAFHQAGQALAAASHQGTLQRGIRAVLAHHVIFHWNRLGLTHGTQSLLAREAQAVILANRGEAAR